MCLMSRWTIIITSAITKARATCCSCLPSARTWNLLALFDVVNGLEACSNTTSVKLHEFFGHTGYAHAEACFRQNIACLPEELSPNLLEIPGLPGVFSRAWLAWGLAELGGFAEAQAHCMDAVQMAEAVKHPFSLAVAYWSTGFVALSRGDCSAAITWLEHGLDLCQRADLAIWLPWMTSCLGAAYTVAGRVTAAVPLLEQAVERAAHMGLMGFQARRLAWLGEAYLLAGRVPDAVECAERSLTLVHERQELSSLTQAFWLRGECAACCRSPERKTAETAYHQAQAQAQALGMRPLLAHCHRSLGTLYDRLGEAESARLALSAAAELFRGMDMTFWLSRAEAALARVS
jgi:tetratricopeptide (TPR) repeat protein